jgi:hypothetical protein
MRHVFFTSLAILALSSSTCTFAGDLLTLKVDEAERGTDQTGKVTLNIRLSENGRHLFGWWTARHVRKIMSVSIDGRVVSAARLMSPLTGGVLGVVGPSADEIDTWIPKLLDGRSVLSVDSDD